MAGFADHISRLAETLIAIDGWIVDPKDRDSVAFTVETDNGEAISHARIIWFRRKDLPREGIGFLAIFEVEDDFSGPPQTYLEFGRDRVRLAASQRRRNVDNMVSRVNELAELLHPREMHRISDFVFDAHTLALSGDLIFARNSNELWQIHNRSISDTLLTPDLPFAIAIDAALAIDDTTVALTGWLRSRQDEFSRFDMVFADGSHIPLIDTLTRFERSDVRDHFGEVCFNGGTPPGFATLVRLPEALIKMPFRFEVSTETGSSGVVEKPIIRSSSSRTRRLLLSAITPAGITPQDIHERFLDPALKLLSNRARGRELVKEELTFGRRHANPEVSIVVPVFRGSEFVTQQIVQFAKDPALCRHELIYVLDSPEEAGQFKRLLYQLHALYGVDCRLLVLKENSGYAVTNNQGVMRARGEYVLLLNQDVLPDKPGWLDQLVAFHRESPSCGLAGPKLLYEDDSIQHAGMYFDRVGESPYWNNFHYYKGLHREFPGASENAKVPGITGACMLLKRAVYNDLGGLDEDFVHGDFEDSDLSLRCQKAGMTNYYCGSVSLYHLERQSFGEIDKEPWRKIALDYNLWRQSKRWGSYLGELVQARAISNE